MTQQTGGNSVRSKVWIPLLLLVLAAVIPFLPAVRGAFVWDDEELHGGAVERVGNPLGFFVPGGGGGGMEGRAARGNYYPVSMVAFWCEYRVFGREVVGYHVVNLLLHAGNVVLVWVILRRLKAPWAFLAAMVFAVHPLGVETVAYVSELKNLLSGVFFLLAVFCWLKWRLTESGVKNQEARSAEGVRVSERRGGSSDGRVGSAEHAQGPFPEHGTRGHVFYAGVVVCFVLAMMAKSVTCTLPVVLLLVEYWRWGREARRAVVETVPLFVVGGVMAGVFEGMEHSAVGASGAGFGFSVGERVLIAGRAVWFYMGKFFWPVGLLTVYPKWGIDVGAAVQWVFPVAAVVVVGGLWGLRKWVTRGGLWWRRCLWC